MPKTTFLDPLVIAQLGNLQLRARRILDGLYLGHHTNPVLGSSQEFSEHRPYSLGDDLKRINWKAFGRTDRLVIKQFEEETNIAGHVLIDDSASMGFSYGGRPTKLEYAKTMAAAIGYLLVSQHDGIGLSSPQFSLPARSDRAHLELFFKTLEQLKPHGRWDVNALKERIGSPLKKRSLVMVFSDLLEDEETVIQALRHLHSRRHDVIVFQIFDPAEKDLPFSGAVLFEDAETKETIRTEPDVLRERYKEIVKERLSVIAQTLRGSGIDYVFLTTDTPFQKGLMAYLTFRAARL